MFNGFKTNNPLTRGQKMVPSSLKFLHPPPPPNRSQSRGEKLIQSALSPSTATRLARWGGGGREGRGVLEGKNLYTCSRTPSTVELMHLVWSVSLPESLARLHGGGIPKGLSATTNVLQPLANVTLGFCGRATRDTGTDVTHA